MSDSAENDEERRETHAAVTMSPSAEREREDAISRRGSSTLDTNIDFLVEYDPRDKTFYYPSNSHFRQRVREEEWVEFIASSQQRSIECSYWASFVLLLVCLVICVTVWVPAVILAAFFFVATLVLVLCSNLRVKMLMRSYNKALFNPRGVMVSYFAGSQQKQCHYRIRLAYPANYQNCIDSFGTGDMVVDELLIRFRKSNEEFSQSIASTYTHPVDIVDGASLSTSPGPSGRHSAQSESDDTRRSPRWRYKKRKTQCYFKTVVTV